MDARSVQRWYWGRPSWASGLCVGPSNQNTSISSATGPAGADGGPRRAYFACFSGLPRAGAAVAAIADTATVHSKYTNSNTSTRLLAARLPPRKLYLNIDYCCASTLRLGWPQRRELPCPGLPGVCGRERQGARQGRPVAAALRRDLLLSIDSDNTYCINARAGWP